MNPSPHEGEGGACAAQPRGRERARPGYDEETLKRAKALRREMTQTERELWSCLRAGRLSGHKFRRQQPIGPYIADFVCQEARLVVELDGSQHIDSEHDRRRDAFLGSAGYRVLRFWNSDLAENRQGVLEEILAAVECPLPPTAVRRAPPFPSRGKG
jgi:very-short-patch-repair endonuclease